MPEGHTIRRMAQDQNRDLQGQVVEAVAGQARFREGAERLHGQIHVEADAWGKHLFHTFDSGDLLHVHLGLFGRWIRRPHEPWPEISPTARLRMGGDDAAWDLSGPMTCELVSPDERDAVVAKLGPDPLRDDADPERAWARIHRSGKAIGLLLMEQDVIAGIGNVYRSEILNIVGMDPRRPGKAVTRAEFDDIWGETRRQLRLGVRRRKIVTMRTEELTRPVSKLRRGEGRYVYKQHHCGRCGTELDIFPIAARTTWCCPTCQPR